MTEGEILSFNSQFTLYEGKRKSGSQMLQLLKAVNASNNLKTNKVAVKLTGRNFVFDSCKYLISDNETNNIIICNSSKIVSLDEIISNINKYTYYNVDFYYCNPKTQSLGNNKDLNPIIGCILLIHISKNY